jgi:antitoxin ParD1/3/4
MGMNVSLPKDLMDYVKSQVDGGRYSSASEMVRDALRQLKQFEKMREQAHADLAREVELGWADSDAGRVSDFDPEAIKAAGRERLARKSS